MDWLGELLTVPLVFTRSFDPERLHLAAQRAPMDAELRRGVPTVPTVALEGRQDF